MDEDMVRKPKEVSEQTRVALLHAALDVFCQKGYSRTTFDDVAGKINLTKGAAYWYFENKADLLINLIKEFWVVKRYQCDDIKTWEELRFIVVDSAKKLLKDEEYRKFLYFVFLQMEWSEALVAKVRVEVPEIINYPNVQLNKALSDIQKNGGIDESVNIPELAMIVLHLWKGAVADEIQGTTYALPFEEMIGKSMDFVIAAVRKDRKD